MTEDVYKQLAASYGSQLWLRLRCHSDVCVARHYGHLSPDAEVANLFHLAGCHAHTSVENTPDTAWVPARPKRLIGRGGPKRGAAWSAIWRCTRPPEGPLPEA